MVTDAWFFKGADSTVQLHTKYYNQTVYYYLFGYRGSISVVDIIGDTEHKYGKQLKTNKTKAILNFIFRSFTLR